MQPENTTEVMTFPQSNGLMEPKSGMTMDTIIVSLAPPLNGLLKVPMEPKSGLRMGFKDGRRHRDGGLPAIERSSGTKEWWVNGQPHREGGLPAVEMENGDMYWYVNGKLMSNERGRAYMSFCNRMRIKAQKKLYFWWVQICYDMDHSSGCGQRMAIRNVSSFEGLMNQQP